MNLNVAPYNDDFSEDKNFYKVLFKPGYEVQSRELNTLQSILQNQVASIGNHLFKNGAKITGCSSSFIQYDYVRLNDTFNNIDIDLTNYNNKTLNLVGATSEIEATIVDVKNKGKDNPPTLFVVYTKTGIDNEQSTFVPGEDVNFVDENDVIIYTATVKCPTCAGNEDNDTTNPTGKSLFFNISDGIFYYNGYFVRTDNQHLIIDPYLTKDSNGYIISDLTYRVGLKVTQSVITAEEDESLYDNHLGYPNYAAEGADRLKISMDLATTDYPENSESTDFITLAKVRQNHVVEYKKDDTEYGDIMKELARRTYESSGNFTVTPWKTQFLNEYKKDASDKKGWSLNGLDENFTTILSPGIGYVKGYRVSSTSEVIVSGRKSRDTNKLRGAAITFSDRAYITVTTDENISWISHTGSSTMSNQKFNLLDVNDISIGSFKAYDIYKTGTNTYKIYLYDITMVGQKTIAMAKSVKLTDNSFIADIVENTTLESANNSSLLFKLSHDSVKSIRDNDNSKNGNTSVELRKRLNGILNGNGSITFNTVTNELFTNPFNGNIICWVGNNPDGVNINISRSNTTYSPTSMTLNLGAGNSGKNVTFITSVLRTSQTEKTKTLTRHSFTTDSKPNSETNSVVELPYADGYRLESVKLVSISDPEINEDITSEYDFDNGQTENFYLPVKLKRNTPRSFNSDDRLIITFYYFEHSGSANFFTVDSYAQLVNDPDINLEYSDIPSYTDKNGNVYKLAEYIDFRSIKSASTGVDNQSLIPAINSNMVYDIEYYLPRSDLLQVNQDGTFYYKEGIPSDNPVLPEKDENAMPLYEVYLSPYVYSLNDIKTKYIDNKRFTANDIGKIENRIKNVESAVALSLLEQQTLNMSIKDQNGYDRYKNGFLVDNFKTYSGSDLKHKEFKAALDRNKGLLRPQFKQNNVKLLIDLANCTNVSKKGNMMITDYTSDLFITNPYSTQDLSINPYFIFRKTGTLVLSPNIDTWSEEEILPEIVTNVDTGVEALKDIAEAADLLSTDYGSWVDFNSTVLGSTTTSTTSVSGRTTTTNTTTSTTTRTDSMRSVTTTSIGSETQTYSVDDVVKDVSIIPMIRSNTIQFYASNMKPNTRLYAYFDGINVTAHCKTTTQITNDINAAIFGANPLLTDDNGNITGEFRIPANTFFTGEKKFVLTNDPNNTGNADVETTRSESSYFAGGVSQTKQSSTLNIVSPTYNTNVTSENRSTTSVSRETNTTTVTEPEPAVVETPTSEPITTNNRMLLLRNARRNARRFSGDPVAQAFKVEESCFISKIGVYFSAVDTSSDIIWFEIRELVNGYPSTEYISRKEVKPKSLESYVSNDASKEYQIEFSAPTYVDSTKSYCIAIGGYSPDTRVFISKLGEKLIGSSDTYLESPPLTYTMFRSLNGETWNAEQFDTLKFNLYRCIFDTNGTNFAFKAENSFKLKCEAAPIEVEQNSNKVRVYAKNHGLRVDDRVNLSFNKEVYYKISIASGVPQIGQKITVGTSEGYIKDIKLVGSNYQISIDDLSGTIEENDTFVCEASQYEYNDDYVLSEIEGNNSQININEASGVIEEIITKTRISNIAGSSIGNFAKEHIVKAVDSIDSFIIEVNGTYNESGRFGGSNVMVINNNINFDAINISAQYLSYNSSDRWSINAYDTISGNVKNGIEITPLADNYMDSPKSILSSKNQTILLGSDSSLSLNINTTLRNRLISPIINIDSVSAITISNRIDNLTESSYSIAPNANRWIEETDPINGSENYKHITTKVLLENPANDMRILFDVMTTNNSDFDVYVKLLTPQDTDESTINWIKFDKYDKVRSNNIDPIEYDLTLSEHCNSWDDTVEYISYRVKLVGKSSNTSQPVIFRNFRAIAIT